MKDEIEKINACVDESSPNYIYASKVLNSKIKIYQFFITAYFEHFDRRDLESKKIISEITANLNKATQDLSDLIIKLDGKIQEKGATVKQQIENIMQSSLMDDKKRKSHEEQINNLNRKNNYLEKYAQDEVVILKERIEQLEKENKLMTDTLLKKAKSISNFEKSQEDTSLLINNQSRLGINQSQNQINQSQINQSVNYSKKNEKLVDISQNQINYNNSHEVALNKSKSGANIIINPTGPRTLTKNMMREIIEEIYDSKKNFDKLCDDNKTPYETLEQHMYTYLNHKYGLKNLIIEWATSIINGIKLFSSEDSDICLFGKIMRNEIEDDSHLILKKLKATISDILLYFIKAKNPYKSNGELKDISKSKMDSFILEEEWKGIIYYVYETEDAKLLEARIIDFISKKYFDKRIVNCNRKLTREELVNISKMKEDFKILYLDFQKILADFQIKTRENYLRNFVYLFKCCDRDNNGVINEEEFIELLSKTGCYNYNLEEEVSRLLNLIDPFNNKHFTFSECVSLFTLEMIVEEDGDGNQRKLSILDKICMEEQV